MEKKRIVSLLILLGFIVLGGFLLKGRTHELTKIFEVDLRYVVILLILTILVSLLRGDMIRLLMNSYGVPFRFKEGWSLEIIGEFCNAVSPFQGGLPAKAIYLKKKYKFPYTSSVSITGVTYLLNFLIYGLFGTIFSLFLSISDTVKYSLLAMFIFLLLASIFMLFFIPLPIKSEVRVLKYVVRGINGFEHIRTNPYILLKMMINSLARFLISATRLYFAFLAFDFELPFHVIGIISIFSNTSTLLSITPMNLGIREAVVVITSNLLGVGALIAVFAATLDRVISIIWVLISTYISGYILLKNFKLKDSIKASEGVIPKNNQKG